jgi:hypothetical protein
MASIADVLAAIPPGALTVAVRTPLGVSYADPFAPGPSPVSDTLKWLGVEIAVYPGPPRDEDINAASLGQNLTVAGLVAAGAIAYFMLRPRSRR